MKEILKNLVHSIVLPKDTYLEQDDEILEIFVEELEDIFGTLPGLLENWPENASLDEQLIMIRRSFHTLKGSGRMVGANSTSELAWNVEDNLNRVISKNRELTPELQNFVRVAANLYRHKIYHDFKNNRAHNIDLRPLLVLGDEIQKKSKLRPELQELLNLAQTLTDEFVVTGLEITEEFQAELAQAEAVVLELANSGALDRDEDATVAEDEPVAQEEPLEDESVAEEVQEAVFEPVLEEPTISASEQEERDNFVSETLEIFFEEAEDHIATINHFIQLDSFNAEQFNRLVRALHTLRGSSSMAHVDDIFEATSKLDHLFKIFVQDDHEIDHREYDLLKDYITFAEDYIRTLKAPDYKKFDLMLICQNFNEAWAKYDAESTHEQKVAQDEGSAVSQLVSLNIDQLLDAEYDFEKLAFAEYPEYFESLSEQAQLLMDNTNNATALGIYHFTTTLKESYDAVLKDKQLLDNDYAFELFAQAHQHFIHLFDALASGQRVILNDEAHQVLDDLRDYLQQERAITPHNEALDVVDAPESIEDVVSLSQRDIDISALTESNQLDESIEADSAVTMNIDDVLSFNTDQAIRLNLKEDSKVEDVEPENIESEKAESEDTVADLDQIDAEETSLESTVEDVLVDESISATAETVASEDVAELEETVTPIAVEQDTTAVDLSEVVTAIRLDTQLKNSPETIVEFDLDVLDIFIEEADELLGSIDTDLAAWSEEIGDTKALNNLMRHLHTLKGGANMAQALNIGLIAHELETIYELVIKGQLQSTAYLVQNIRVIQDNLADRIQTLNDDKLDFPATHVIAVLDGLVHQKPAQFAQVAETLDVEVQADQSVDVDDIAFVETDTAVEETLADESVTAQADDSAVVDEVADTLLQDTISNEVADQPVDEEIFDIYIGEATELVEEGLNLLNQWIDQRHNRSLLLQLQRSAHSIKGGAKMVKLSNIAEVAYELETAFEQFGVHHFNSNAYDSLLESAFIWLRSAVVDRNYDFEKSIISQLKNIQYVDVTAQLPSKLTRTDFLTQDYVFEFVEGDGTEPPSMMGEWSDTTNLEQNDEMIRISADTIEKMIDLSGENAINRSRIEMDLSQFGHTLSDMELAIQRLADQLRRMEGELESQIIAKHGDTASRYSDFDPLEMDQYSSLNQLSKSLAESASDLVDFKTTLAEKIKDTEGILLQQSRIQAEIQEGLMRARLVPFSRLLPRLQRLVRQVSTTLNKPAELFVNNTEGELDRTILEKLVSPLEHMLRNSLDHGIEDAETRAKLKKPATGKIELDISRQGTDVVISFKDDGQGINADRVKEKALSLNLIQADQQLTAEQALQFIFHPGLSTAEKVTQISGRGVGLDVVQSSIKALGGEVTVESELGKGSTFKIRVPTTVAVSDALMVKVLDQQFAVPLSQIDRIVRISPVALEGFFGSQDEHYEIDGQSYKLRYLAEFVGSQPTPKLSGVAHSLPVLLIKGNMGQTSAVLVDQLVGSRSQIVMKPIGDQFTNVGAISGATILGDGQVCLILDGQNIARQIQVSDRQDAANTHRDHVRHRDQRRLVMIVDDSVTVRKVTSRLLERQGFDVITAKDGVEAIELLQNTAPDLMLLDIEMPRMDGFEVTSLVRHDELHQDLPIIMITSRTGEKHRERAMSLGVNNYMGKPFQEAELMEAIQSLLETQ